MKILLLKWKLDWWKKSVLTRNWMVACRRRISKRLASNYEADIWYVSGFANLSDTSPAPEKYLYTLLRRRRSIYIRFSDAGEIFIYTPFIMIHIVVTTKTRFACSSACSICCVLSAMFSPNKTKIQYKHLHFKQGTLWSQDYNCNEHCYLFWRQFTCAESGFWFCLLQQLTIRFDWWHHLCPIYATTAIHNQKKHPWISNQ